MIIKTTKDIVNEHCVDDKLLNRIQCDTCLSVGLSIWNDGRIYCKECYKIQDELSPSNSPRGLTRAMDESGIVDTPLRLGSKSNSQSNKHIKKVKK